MTIVKWLDRDGNNLEGAKSVIYHSSEGEIVLTDIHAYTDPTTMKDDLKIYLDVEGTDPEGERKCVLASKVTRRD